MKNLKIFTVDNWEYFCSKINFGETFLDTKAIRIMNKSYDMRGWVGWYTLQYDLTLVCLILH